MHKKSMSPKPGFVRALLVTASFVAYCGFVFAPSSAQAQEADGPCAQYAQELCEKAGAASCQSIKMATDLMPPRACEAGLDDLEFSYGRLAELKKQCAELGDKLCADLGEDTETCKMVRSKVPDLPPDQCQGMLGQYPKVLADLQKQEAANKPLDAAQQKAVATGTDAVFGAANAKVTVVEFSDFECPYCSRAANVATGIKKKYPEDVRFVFRQYPLSFHKNAHLASQAALAAGAQGKFWEYHDVLFQNQKQLDRASLEKYAADLELDMAKFKKALDDGTYKDAVDADIALGNMVAVSGTPTMFVNGQRAKNPTDLNSVSAEIDAAMKAAN
jgi:protein-disulfide isomerase